MTLHRSSKDHDAKVAYRYLVALGIGFLFSFASLTQPIDYWGVIFPTYKYSVEYAISAVYVWVNVIVLLLIVIWGGIPIFKRRIYGGFFCQFLILLAIPTSYFLHLSEDESYWIIICATTFVSIATAFTASAAIAFTAQYPIEIQSGYQMGIGLSTLIGSCFRILTKLALPTDAIVDSSLLFFYSGAMVIVLVTVFYKRLLALPCSDKYIVYGLSPSETTKRHNRIVRQDQELTFFKQDICESSPLVSKSSSAAAPVNYSSGKEIPVSKLTNTGSYYDIFLKIYPAYFPVMIVYSVTLMLWPSLVTEIHSFNFPYLDESQWWSLILLFVYAAMDCAGRFFVGYLPACLNKNNMCLFSLYRSLIIVPICCCVKGFVLRNDLFSLLFVSILGASNGYLGSTSIMMVNEWCENQDEIGHAGVITGLVINFSLAVGALFASVIHLYI
jgi:solute carrier family 29 (equilibrative nucleoside transporter), member 1/2/3